MNDLPKRKYFEVWGDLEAQNNTLKLILSFLCVLLLVSMGLTYLATKKPPVVIRVQDIGKAEAVQKFSVNNQITEAEYFFFTKLFIRKFTEYNSYTVSSEITEAFSLMTSNYQKIAKKEVIDSNLISKISQASINTKIEIREIKLEREDDNYAVISFLGLRSITSYNDRDFIQDSLFKGDIILKKVSRNMNHPQGLLVDEYREILVKQLDE